MIRKLGSAVIGVAWHPGDKLLATASTDSRCRIFCASPTGQHFALTQSPASLWLYLPFGALLTYHKGYARGHCWCQTRLSSPLKEEGKHLKVESLALNLNIFDIFKCWNQMCSRSIRVQHRNHQLILPSPVSTSLGHFYTKWICKIGVWLWPGHLQVTVITLNSYCQAAVSILSTLYAVLVGCVCSEVPFCNALWNDTWGDELWDIWKCYDPIDQFVRHKSAGDQLACSSHGREIILLKELTVGKGGISFAATQRLQSRHLPFRCICFLSEDRLLTAGFDSRPFAFQKDTSDNLWQESEVLKGAHSWCLFHAVLYELSMTYAMEYITLLHERYL